MGFDKFLRTPVLQNTSGRLLLLFNFTGWVNNEPHPKDLISILKVTDKKEKFYKIQNSQM